MKRSPSTSRPSPHCLLPDWCAGSCIGSVDVDVVVVGAGQAGLSVSRALRLAGVEHVVLEASDVAASWRGRWDSFTLVTPNWTMDLPGHPYTGDDPEGHVVRDDIVAYLEAVAADAGPVERGVAVQRLGRGRRARFLLETSDGPREAETVVVCTGAYQRPHRPLPAEAFPPSLTVLDAEGYRNPDQLPPGRVLVVGSGQTGIQLTEELQDLGVTLAGRLERVDGHTAYFADDLAASVAFGDARYDDIRKLVADRCPEAPPMPQPPPFVAHSATSVELRDFGAVVFTSGFRPDHQRWVEFPVFDGLGFPVVEADLTTSVPGLYFCGVHFLRKRKSSLLFGVGEDAELVAASIAASAGA
jgi:thioredoxin reductase